MRLSKRRPIRNLFAIGVALLVIVAVQRFVLVDTHSLEVPGGSEATLEVPLGDVVWWRWSSDGPLDYTASVNGEAVDALHGDLRVHRHDGDGVAVLAFKNPGTEEVSVTVQVNHNFGVVGLALQAAFWVLLGLVGFLFVYFLLSTATDKDIVRGAAKGSWCLPRWWRHRLIHGGLLLLICYGVPFSVDYVRNTEFDAMREQFAVLSVAGLAYLSVVLAGLLVEYHRYQAGMAQMVTEEGIEALAERIREGLRARGAGFREEAVELDLLLFRVSRRIFRLDGGRRLVVIGLSDKPERMVRFGPVEGDDVEEQVRGVLGEALEGLGEPESV